MPKYPAGFHFRWYFPSDPSNVTRRSTDRMSKRIKFKTKNIIRCTTSVFFLISPSPVQFGQMSGGMLKFIYSFKFIPIYFRRYSTNGGRLAWYATADFVEFILNLWQIMNVKTPHLGQKKLDDYRDPIRSPMDWQLGFLEDFVSFLGLWQANRYSGLSRETFLAVRHTCEALILIAK